MATGTVYLDVDDEITSAAARIRGSEATKVALVVPYGSRIATSRMNFRLLSREAVVNNRRLSIVATDPATRALAASAGLPVFASVAEWDVASAGTGNPTGDAATATDAPAGGVAEAVPKPTSAPPSSSRSRKRPSEPLADDAQTLGLATASVAAGGPAPAVSPVGVAASPSVAPAATQAAARIPVARSRAMPRIGGLVVVIVAGLVVALVVAGVGAYVFLPSATIVVTPREEPMEIDLVVRADPDATAPDAATSVVPSQVLDVPVSVSDSFTASDRRIEEEVATGKVEFQSFNTGSPHTIAKGAVVSTEGGNKFTTTAAVTLDKAQVLPGTPVTIRPSVETVGIVAVKKGTAGNVPPNAITIIPPGEDPDLTKVRNLAPTTGGTHEEFPRISQKDVDTAMASLQPKLLEAFNAALADGAGAPANTTLFPETAVLNEATPTLDPAKLVGKEQASFELGLTAAGTVIAVDPSPVTKIAETRLLSNVGTDHRLVEGSIAIVPGDPTVLNGEISFPVTATAARVRILDPAQLRALIRGRSIAEARTLLAEFGDAVVTPWPDWVSTMPGIDSRVTIEIVGQTDQEGQGSPRPSGAVSPSSSARPTTTARPPGTGGSPGTGSPGTSSPSSAAAPAASAAP